MGVGSNGPLSHKFPRVELISAGEFGRTSFALIEVEYPVAEGHLGVKKKKKNIGIEVVHEELGEKWVADIMHFYSFYPGP